MACRPLSKISKTFDKMVEILSEIMKLFRGNPWTKGQEGQTPSYEP
jgi:hypothetical protein